MKPDCLIVINHYKAVETEAKFIRTPKSMRFRGSNNSHLQLSVSEGDWNLGNLELSEDSEAWELCPFGHLTPRNYPSP
jgi:hypothetical protein